MPQYIAWTSERLTPRLSNASSNADQSGNELPPYHPLQTVKLCPEVSSKLSSIALQTVKLIRAIMSSPVQAPNDTSAFRPGVDDIPCTLIFASNAKRKLRSVTVRFRGVSDIETREGLPSREIYINDYRQVDLQDDRSYVDLEFPLPLHVASEVLPHHYTPATFEKFTLKCFFKIAYYLQVEIVYVSRLKRKIPFSATTLPIKVLPWNHLQYG
jgi:hypothetical protein